MCDYQNGQAHPQAAFASDTDVKSEFRKVLDWMMASETLRTAVRHERRVNVTLWFEKGRLVGGPYMDTKP